MATVTELVLFNLHNSFRDNIFQNDNDAGTNVTSTAEVPILAFRKENYSKLIFQIKQTTQTGSEIISYTFYGSNTNDFTKAAGTPITDGDRLTPPDFNGGDASDGWTELVNGSGTLGVGITNGRTITDNWTWVLATAQIDSGTSARIKLATKGE